MQFLIPVRDLAARVDPDEGVADLLGAVLARLVDADVDGQAVLAGFFAQAEDEGGFTCGLAEGDGFGGRAADVVGCFGEEQGLSGCPVSWWFLREMGRGDWTFAPAATAFWITVRHWARLCAMLAVEHIWPTACGLCQ